MPELVCPPSLPKDTFDETVVQLGVPLLLQHAAEAHKRDTEKLTNELKALRSLLGKAAAAAVADIHLDVPASASANWKDPTTFDPEDRSMSTLSVELSPRSKLASKQSPHRMYRHPSSFRASPPLKEADESKFCFQPEGGYELTKLSDQMKRMEEAQKDQTAKLLAEIGGIKVRQIRQQADLEEVRKDKDAPTSKSNAAPAQASNSPRMALLSARSGHTELDLHSQSVLETHRSSGSMATAVPATSGQACQAAEGTKIPAWCDAADARAALMGYEDTFRPRPPAPVAPAGTGPTSSPRSGTQSPPAAAHSAPCPEPALHLRPVQGRPSLRLRQDAAAPAGGGWISGTASLAPSRTARQATCGSSPRRALTDAAPAPSAVAPAAAGAQYCPPLSASRSQALHSLRPSTIKEDAYPSDGTSVGGCATAATSSALRQALAPGSDQDGLRSNASSSTQRAAPGTQSSGLIGGYSRGSSVFLAPSPQ